MRNKVIYRFILDHFRWRMASPVEGTALSELLHEYIEREEAEMPADFNVESCIYSSRYSMPPLFDHLTWLNACEYSNDKLQDSRVVSYVLANARQLKTLKLNQEMLNMDEAFTRRPIGAPLEELELRMKQITDVTIDVLCQQLAATLRSLTLSACEQVTREGFNKVIRYLMCLRWLHLNVTNVYIFRLFFCLKGIIRLVRELKHLRELDLRYSRQVDNSILEAAVSVLERDETRKLYIDCRDTNVNIHLFRTRYKDTRHDPNGLYVYKNLEVLSSTLMYQ